MTYEDESTHECTEYSIPFYIDLHSIIEKVQDPSSGLLSYKGVETAPWDGLEYDIFDFSLGMEIHQEPLEVIYSEVGTGKMCWAELPDKQQVAYFEHSMEEIEEFEEGTFNNHCVTKCRTDHINQEILRFF